MPKVTLSFPAICLHRLAFETLSPETLSLETLALETDSNARGFITRIIRAVSVTANGSAMADSLASDAHS